MIKLILRLSYLELSQLHLLAFKMILATSFRAVVSNVFSQLLLFVQNQWFDGISVVSEVGWQRCFRRLDHVINLSQRDITILEVRQAWVLVEENVFAKMRGGVQNGVVGVEVGRLHESSSVVLECWRIAHVRLVIHGRLTRLRISSQCNHCSKLAVTRSCSWSSLIIIHFLHQELLRLVAIVHASSFLRNDNLLCGEDVHRR